MGGFFLHGEPSTRDLLGLRLQNNRAKQEPNGPSTLSLHGVCAGMCRAELSKPEGDPVEPVSSSRKMGFQIPPV